MFKDVKCPYCGEWQEICHDDGQGYEEDLIHEQECHSCEKVFGFTTSITFYYEAHQADCLNGGEHDLKSVISSPRYWPDWVSCRNCQYESRGEYKEPEEPKDAKSN